VDEGFIRFGAVAGNGILPKDTVQHHVHVTIGTHLGHILSLGIV
jgi:hypothetical protein